MRLASEKDLMQKSTSVRPLFSDNSHMSLKFLLPLVNCSSMNHHYMIIRLARLLRVDDSQPATEEQTPQTYLQDPSMGSHAHD